MDFYLGTHQPHWLVFSPYALFVSHNRLHKRMTFPRAKSPWSLDSGGFTQITKHGRFLHHPDLYAEYAKLYMAEIGNLSWAAPQDWMCEPIALKATGLTVRQHQLRTVENYQYLASRHPEVPWVPVLQGWVLRDYLICLRMYEHAGVEMRGRVVAVGSVCRRQSTREIGEIFSTLHGEGLAMHGFGVKIDGIKMYGHLLASSDSLAWSATARYQPRLDGCSHNGSCANCWRWAVKWRQQVMEAIGSSSGAVPRFSSPFGRRTGPSKSSVPSVSRSA